MLLRSSSIPVLGSLLSSLSETPYNNHYQYEAPNATPTSIHQKLSYGSQHHPKSLWHSSPSSTSQSSPSGFQRVQSGGNLEELANVDEFSFSNVYKKYACKTNCSRLEPVPSFSSCNLETCQEDEDRDEDDEEEENEWDVESIEENGEFISENQFNVHNMHIKEEMKSE